MTDSPVRLALRELQADYSRPVTWAALVGVGLVMSFAGAFGTAGTMRALPLAIYWVGIVVITFGAGSFTAGVLRRLLPGLPSVLRILVMGIGAGLVISAVIIGLNTAIFGSFFADTVGGLVRFAVTTTGVALIVTTVVDLAISSMRNAPNDTDTQQDIAPAPPPLLARLPVGKRGALISLTALDHYVEVTTEAGQELILIRLADAIAETAPEAGFQIHRSHWVARAQIQGVARNGSKGTVTLSDGRDLPVSRTYMPDLKAAGLLPKAGG